MRVPYYHHKQITSIDEIGYHLIAAEYWRFERANIVDPL